MKKQYKKRWGWKADHPRDFFYDHVSGGYFRSMHTFQERRRNNNDLADSDLRDLKVKVRRARTGNRLDPWNLERGMSRNGSRCWKDFTRHGRQWGVGFDPDPQWENWQKNFYMRWEGDLPW